MKHLLQIISTSRALFIFIGLCAHPRECGTQPPLNRWRKRPRVFDYVSKQSWERVWTAGEVCTQTFSCLQQARWISVQLASSEAQLGGMGS